MKDKISEIATWKKLEGKGKGQAWVVKPEILLNFGLSTDDYKNWVYDLDNLDAILNM